MKIDGNTITFKSIDDFYFKEKAGIKPNTVRFLEDWDEITEMENFEIDLENEVKYITIQNKISPHLNFKRQIRDISRIYTTPQMWVWIISWFHEEDGSQSGYNAPIRTG